MATHTVKQSGGEFTTLASALADAGTAAGDTIEISGSWTVDDTACAAVVDSNITIQAVGSSKCLGYASPSTGWYRLRTATTDTESLLINAVSGTVVDGLEVRQNGDNTATDMEMYAFRGLGTPTGSLTFRNCLAWSTVVPTYYNHSGFYVSLAAAQVVSVTYENCIAYGFYNKGFSFRNSSGISGTNLTGYLNSCTVWDNGEGVNVEKIGDLSTVSVYYFNSISVGNTTDYSESGAYASEIVFDIHNCIDGDNSIASRGGNTDCLASRTETDDNTPGSGDWVVFKDITNSPYDLRLESSSENDAQDMHSASSGAGCTMPSTDIAGVSRPVNTNYDCGAFEIPGALTQYSYRFLNDNGDEDESGFAANLNTAVTLNANDVIRLRVLIDGTGDPESSNLQLEYRHKPTGGSFGDWQKVQ